MKARTLFVAVLCFLGLGGTAAAAPTIQPLQFDSVILGGAAVLDAYVSDPAENRSGTTFSVSGPAVRNPLNLGAVTWPGFNPVGPVNLYDPPGVLRVIWSPPQIGTYMVRVVVVGSSGTTTQYGYFETVVDRFTVPTNTIIESGDNQMFLDSGEIRTQESDTQPPSSVLVKSGGNLIFWAGGRVALKPGFWAKTGSFFWAAVDHDMNGYSDVEEATDSDGDGLPDAWEIDHGLNPFDPSDADSTNLQKYHSGHQLVPTSGTEGFQLILRAPSNAFFGVNTNTWAISPVQSQ